MTTKYRFRDLDNLYNANADKIKSGENIATFDAKLSIAAGYAMDLMDTARNAGVHRVRLDMTMNTEKYTDKALMVVAMLDLEKGMSEEECVDDLIKKAASYELFTLCNLLTDFGCENELIYEPEMSENLLIKAKKLTKEDETITFDPKLMMEELREKCFMFIHLEQDEPSPLINLDLYKNRVSGRLLEQL